MKKIGVTTIHQRKDQLEIFLFNVGQGDHLLIKFPGLEYGIIDFYYDPSVNLPAPPALTYFQALEAALPPEEFKKINISFFCISHTDKDHIKGVAETLQWFDDHHVFIQEFWFGAARDENQLVDFLDTKMTQYFERLPWQERSDLLNQKKLFNKNLYAFFKSFKKWKDKGFKAARYKRESTGTGDYLTDIKSLRKPSGCGKTKAFNVGPLSGHLDEYYQHVTDDIARKIICGDSSGTIDKNDLSHILCIKYGGKTLLFGGDTHKDVWEDCLERYHDPNFEFLQQFGPLQSHFLKVSHHGSRNSSSKRIWQNVLSSEWNNLLGISSGTNLKYKHPHSETLEEIRASGAKHEILATNICHACLEMLPYPKEIHEWYRPESDPADPEIGDIISSADLFISEPEEKHNLGLLAYIFTVPESSELPISVRVALSPVSKPRDCFYGHHSEKLCANCHPEHASADH